MHRRPVLSLVGASLVLLAACADPVGPPPAASPRTPQVGRALVTPQQLFTTYVAMGTSNSQGVQSGGLNATGQRAAWPKKLADRAGVPMSLPYVMDPGCNPPLVGPLFYNVLLAGAFYAFGAGDDLVGAVSTTCMPLKDGIDPPTNSVAISGADVHDALYSTIETKAAVGARVTELYKRVLDPSQTQVTAMLAQQPTFVSVELAANDVLPASTGRVEAMTPYDNWKVDYDAVLAQVKSTGAAAVLVGLPNDAAKFPSIRNAKEFYSQRGYLLTLGIFVSYKCGYDFYNGRNSLFIPGYVLTLLQKAPVTADCANVPGAVDYVLTANDVAAINAQMGKMNAYIASQAAANGYAYFALSALYDLPKPSFNMYNVLFSNTPFGPNMSLDGVHPSAQGQAILAAAAVQAVNQAYYTNQQVLTSPIP